MTTWQTLTGVFQQVFEDDTIQINEKTTADDIDGWDSLSHVNLIVAVETTFNVRFSQKELLTFKNVGDLVRSIESKIK